eukprot:g3541.t1
MSQSKKKTVVVTGTSTGIGEDTTKTLAAKGWTVFAGVRKQADADRLKDANPNIHPIIIDVTKQDQVNAAFEQVGQAVGEDGLDALVNNAGLAVMGPVEFMPTDAVQRQFDINFFGVIRVTQAAMPLLRKGKPGRIVMVSSVAGTWNFPHGGFYCASKAAVDSMSESFRREVARWGIKVSVVKPGPVKTNFNDTLLNLSKELQEKFPQGSAAREYYGKDLDKFPEAIVDFEKQSAHVSKVTGVICTALNAKSPKPVYFDTWGTWANVGMINRLPTSVVDRQFESLTVKNQ